MGSIRPSNVNVGSLRGSETIEAGVSNKRKATPSDYQYLDYRFKYLFLAKYDAIFKILTSQKKQKVDLLRTQGDFVQNHALDSENISETALSESYRLTNHNLDTARNVLATSHFQESSNGSCSSDSGRSTRSDDIRSERSIQSPISSRSSSRSRPHCPTEVSPLALHDFSFRQPEQNVGVAIDAQDSSCIAMDPSSFRDIILSEHHVEPIMADKVDVVESTRSTCRSTVAFQQQVGDNHDVRQPAVENLEGSHAAAQPAARPTVNRSPSGGEGDSSDSPTSSGSSDTHARMITSRPERGDDLEYLIKDDVLRSDPEVADLVYIKIRGKLEYATPDEIEKPLGSHELSLLRLLELEAFGIVQPNGGVTAYAGSSSSGTSAPSRTSDSNQAIGASSSSASQNGSGGLVPVKDSASPNESPIQQTKSLKGSSKSGTAQSPKARAFRCFHNAIYPAVFCVNGETLQKFRTCTGPGWKSMQHLKEHMQDVHTKSSKRPNSLQCSTCLAEFQEQDELECHRVAVDCTARCPDCNEEFETKALRQEHQKFAHAEEETECFLLELDDKKWKKIKDELKAFNGYSDSLKKRRCEPKPEIELWIQSNTALYEEERSEKARAKARNELGHWYVIYHALAPQTKILDHPFYDTAPIRHDDMAEEKILLANDIIVESRIEAHGPPPSDQDLQREWYRDALRDALRISAKTTRNVTYTQERRSSALMSSSLSAQGSTSNSLMRQQPDFDRFENNMSMAGTPNVHGLSGMISPPQNYLSGAQSGDTMSPESDLMSVGMNHQANWYGQESVTQGNSQYEIDTGYMGFGNNLQGHFVNSASDVLSTDPFPGPPRWPGQGGHQCYPHDP